MGQTPFLRCKQEASVAMLPTGMRSKDGDQRIFQKGGMHRAHSLTHPQKTCFRHLSESPNAWARGCRRFIFPSIILINTWATMKVFMLHLALQPHPILAAVSSHKAAVLSQKRPSRDQLFPVTSTIAPPPAVKNNQPR